MENTVAVVTVREAPSKTHRGANVWASTRARSTVEERPF